MNSVPVVKAECISAVVERAQKRSEMGDYAMNMMNVIHSENKDLCESICFAIAAMNLDDRSNTCAVTVMGLMYDAIKTQIESDELREIFGD